MLITHALGQLKLLEKRMEETQRQITENLFRNATNVDPMEANGGQAKFVEMRMQALVDMQLRYAEMRIAIANANARTEVTVEDAHGRQFTRTVQEWLVWRREVLPRQQSFVKNAIAAIERTGKTPVRGEQSVYVYNVNVPGLYAMVDDLQVMEDNLDTELSVVNATVEI